MESTMKVRITLTDTRSGGTDSYTMEAAAFDGVSIANAITQYERQYGDASTEQLEARAFVPNGPGVAAFILQNEDRFAGTVLWYGLAVAIRE